MALPTDPTAADPAMDDESAPAEGDLSQGFCIEISCLPDGTFKVSGPEPLAEEAEEEQGEPGSEAGQDASSIGEALKLVLAAYKEASAGTAGSEDDQMAAGFNSVRGSA